MTCLLVALGSGCANMMISGATITKSDYGKNSIASYRFANCIDPTSGSSTQKPDATVHLVRKENGLALFERSADGTGTLVTNHWLAADGDHYFAWIGIADLGFEYVFPQGGKREGKRVSYIAMKSSKHSDGSTRPSSTPGESCELLPIAQ